jgi:zinc protease
MMAASLRRLALAATGSLLLALAPAHATNIQRVVSPGGIEAWLVQDATVPIIAMEYAFAGGSVQDPPGKPGVANMVAGTLDEGAGELNAKAFRERLERRAIELSFNDSREYLRGSLRMLKEHRDEAFDLLRPALRSGRPGARPRPGDGDATTAEHEPERHCEPPLLRNGVRRAPLFPAR